MELVVRLHATPTTDREQLAILEEVVAVLAATNRASNLSSCLGIPHSPVTDCIQRASAGGGTPHCHMDCYTSVWDSIMRQLFNELEIGILSNEIINFFVQVGERKKPERACAANAFPDGDWKPETGIRV